MFKIIVWGTGDRGKTAAEIFGTDRINAFIDSDPQKIGKFFYNKPIIDFETYKFNYSKHPILVSIVLENDIIKILKEEQIFYFSYNECPPELMGYGWKNAKKHLDLFSLCKKKVAVYGHTLYSLLVYEYLIKHKYQCRGLIPSFPLPELIMKSFHKFFPFVNISEIGNIDNDTTILQTISDYDCEISLKDCNLKNIFDWKDLIPEYYNPKIALLQNKYHGKRCFIVATGPSLTFHDLEMLHRHNEFCISLNTIYHVFDETDWRPDQYVIVDVGAINLYENAVREMNVKEKFIADSSIDFDYSTLTDEFYIFHSIFTKNTLKEGLISSDFAKYVFNSGTVTAVSLQLAMFEGFEQIYLLGCDCSYLKTGLKHFNEPNDKMQKERFGLLDRVIEMSYYHINGYQKIKEYAESKGIKIYNATRGGYVEVFERVNFDELF